MPDPTIAPSIISNSNNSNSIIDDDDQQATSLAQLQSMAARRSLFGTREVMGVAATRLGGNLSALQWTDLVTMSHAEVGR